MTVGRNIFVVFRGTISTSCGVFHVISHTDGSHPIGIIRGAPTTRSPLTCPRIGTLMMTSSACVGPDVVCNVVVMCKRVTRAGSPGFPMVAMFAPESRIQVESVYCSIFWMGWDMNAESFIFLNVNAE